MRGTSSISFSIAALMGLSMACASAGRQAAWERETPPAAGTTATSTTGSGGADVAAGDAAWQQRDDKAQVEAAIKAWEAAIAANPSDGATMIKVSRAYYFLVDGHIAVEGSMADEAMLELYQKGLDWGEKALLLLDPGFGKTMREGGDFEDAIMKIDAKAMPAAYWYCTNIGRFATIRGLSAKLFYKDRVAAAMSRILELDEKFFYSAADRYFGAFYSALPSIAGKDVEKSKKHFAKALAASPEYLPNKVVKAQYLAIELDDQEMYKSLLDEVIAADAGSNPEIAAENRAAQRTAKKMLGDIDEIF